MTEPTRDPDVPLSETSAGEPQPGPGQARGFRLMGILIVCAAAAACASPVRNSEPPAVVPSTAPSLASQPNPTSQPSTTAAPSGVPSATPLTFASAGAAFLPVRDQRERAEARIWATFSRAGCALEGTRDLCTTEAQVSAAKRYYAALAKEMDAYIAGVEAIPFPDPAATKAASLVIAAQNRSRLALLAARSRTIDEFHRRSDASASTAYEAMDVAEQQLLDALGLPVGP
jgi:hypothetical protein